MKFDESKIFTPLNADGLKKGDKVITTYGLISLKAFVTAYRTSEKLLDIIETVQLIRPDNFENRIITETGNFPFAYLVERSKEKKWRPYKDTAEMVADYKKRFNVNCSDYEMPLIWIKSKDNNVKRLIIDFHQDFIQLSTKFMYYDELFEYHTYLDGSPCGVEEE